MRIEIVKFLQIFICIVIIGCGSGKEMIQISFECNDDTNGGNAVVVTLFQLKNDDNFRFVNAETLLKTPEMALGDELVANTKIERTMVPGEKVELKEFEIKNETAFIGVIADFHSPAPEGWKTLIPLDKSVEKIVIYVYENSITFRNAD